MFGFGKKRLSEEEMRELALGIAGTICLTVLLIEKKVMAGQHMLLASYYRRILDYSNTEENNKIVTHMLTDRFAELNRSITKPSYQALMQQGAALWRPWKEELMLMCLRFAMLCDENKKHADLVIGAGQSMGINWPTMSGLISTASNDIKWRYDFDGFDEHFESMEIMELAVARADFDPAIMGL